MWKARSVKKGPCLQEPARRLHAGSLRRNQRHRNHIPAYQEDGRLIYLPKDFWRTPTGVTTYTQFIPYLLSHTEQRNQYRHVNLELNKTLLNMEVDTGVSVSVTSKNTYSKLWVNTRAPPIESSDVQPQTYAGHIRTLSTKNTSRGFFLQKSDC